MDEATLRAHLFTAAESYCHGGRFAPSLRTLVYANGRLGMTGDFNSWPEVRGRAKSHLKERRFELVRFFVLALEEGEAQVYEFLGDEERFVRLALLAPEPLGARSRPSALA